jgi:hypothetical protein
LVYIANRLEVRAPDYSYFLRKLTVAQKGEQVPAQKARWWGVWNKRLLEAHRHPLAAKTLSVEFRKYFDERPLRLKVYDDPATPKRVYTRLNIRAMRQNHEEVGITTWEEEKRTLTGRTGKVTDDELRAFLNETRKQRAAKS